MSALMIRSVESARPDDPAPSISWAPSRSQFAGAAGAVVTYAAVLVAGHYGVVLPDEVKLAIPATVYGILAYVVAPTARQVAMRLDDGIVRLAASLKRSRVSETTVVLDKEKI